MRIVFDIRCTYEEYKNIKYESKMEHFKDPLPQNR